MLEIRNRKTLRSRINICKNDVKIGDRADSLSSPMLISLLFEDHQFYVSQQGNTVFGRVYLWYSVREIGATPCVFV